MDISPRTIVAPPVDEQDWVQSTHGIDSTLTGTADVSKFTLVEGRIPSGTPVVRNESSKLYEAATIGAGPDTQDAVFGHVYTSSKVNPGSDHVGIAVLWHGVVAADLLPVPDGEEFDAAKGAANILYV